MKAKVSSAHYSPVSYLFIEGWLYALRPLYYTEEKYLSFLKHADLTLEHNLSQARVSLDQLVRLYQLSAVETGDEMMGLWKRPIRSRALQHLLTSVREATSLTSALYRFSTFWNLLLDEYQFTLNKKDNRLVLALEAQDESKPQRFEHMLILKLAHGLISWLDRKEVPVSEDQASILPLFSTVTSIEIVKRNGAWSEFLGKEQSFVRIEREIDVDNHFKFISSFYLLGKNSLQ
jgi:hypothetical protein